MEYQYPDCPYAYSEEGGDPDNGISPGSKFEDLASSRLVISVRQRKQASNKRVSSMLRASVLCSQRKQTNQRKGSKSFTN